MAGPRDDMVLIPRLEDVGKPSAFTRAREEQHAERYGKGRRGHLRRIAQIKAARVARRRMARRRGARVRARKTGGSGMSYSAAARMVNPAGLAIGAVLLVGGVTARLATGRSFGNMGANLNKALLGDLDERARADAFVRKGFQSDDMLMRAVGQTPGTADQVHSIFKDLRDMKQKHLEGVSMFMEDAHFDADDPFSMLIDAVADEIRPAMSEVLQEAAQAIGALRLFVSARWLVEGIRGMFR